VINQVTVLQGQIGDINDLLVLNQGGGEQAVSAGGIGTASASSSKSSAAAPNPTVVDAINMNTEDISANSAAIFLNELSIANNAQRLDVFEQQMESIYGSVSNNKRSINNLEKGLAAIASMPDLYLDNDETFSATASLGAYGDEYGFGTAVAIRGNDYWTFGLTTGYSGGKGSGKLSARVGW